MVVGALLALKIIASNYIKKHKQEIFEGNPRSNDFKEYALDFMSQKSQFYTYINTMGLSGTVSCSNSVVSGAHNKPIQYLIKYSNINPSLEAVEMLDYCISFFNLYSSFKNVYYEMAQSYYQSLPSYVAKFSGSKGKLPIKICGVNKNVLSFATPDFRFSYVSPAGKSSNTFIIPMDMGVLKELKVEISAKVEKKGHSRAQRSAMTNDLREAIKLRDNYTCAICGNSVYKEPNLLLEVDHIKPISQGGKTEASNLQTLCWRCNRKKGNSLDE